MAGRLLRQVIIRTNAYSLCQLDHWEETSVISESQYEIFIQENLSEYVVCKMADILCWSQCAKSSQNTHNTADISTVNTGDSNVLI